MRPFSPGVPQIGEVSVVLSRTALVSWPVLRRAVAAVCALAFLVVSFAHSLHHFDIDQPASGYELSTGTADSAPAPAKTSAADGHCHGCVMVVIATTDQIPSQPLIDKQRPDVRLDSLRPHPPVAENPPPIRAI